MVCSSSAKGRRKRMSIYSLYREKIDQEEYTLGRGNSMVTSLRDFINIYDNTVMAAVDTYKIREEREQALLQAQCIEISIEEELISIQREIRSALLDASRSLVRKPDNER